MLTKKNPQFRLLMVDRYILREVLGVFLGTFLFLLFALLMFQGLRLSDLFIVRGASALSLAKLTLYLTITFLPFALPLSFLLSVLIGFSRLSNDSELVALKAHGLSLRRLSLPIFGFALIVGACTLSLNNQLVPWSLINFKRTEYGIANSRLVSTIKEGMFTSGFFDLLIFADRVDKKQNRLHRVFIHDEREAGNPLTYLAQEAEIIPLKPKTEFGTAILLNLYEGSMHHNHIPSQSYEKIDFSTYQLILEVENPSPYVNPKPSMLSAAALQAEMEKADKKSDTFLKCQCELWRRYATAISPIILVLLAVGVGAYRSRTPRASALFIGLLIILLNWSLQVVGMEISLREWVTPALALQLPNLVSLMIGAYFFRQSSW